MKIQHNKTKTATTIIAAVVIGLVMLSPTTIIPNVNAQQQNFHALSINTLHGKSIPNPLTQSQFETLEKEMPKALSKSDFVKAENIALANKKVQDLIGGKPIELMSQSFWGNMKTNPGVWYPQFNFNVDNKTQVVALVDEQNDTVLKAFVGIPIGEKFGEQNSYSSDFYDNTNPPTNADGVLMDTTAPSFTSSSSYNYTAFLLNAAESGSNQNHLCDPTATDAYWMQAGFDFGTQHPVDTAWTDTFHSCQPQTSSISYASGHSYTFWILPQSGSSNWAAVIKDDSSGSSQTYTDTGMSSYLIDTSFADDFFSLSVFFENNNTQTSSPNWDSQFGSDPSASAQIELGSTWGSWGSGNDNQEDQNCNGRISDNPSNGGPGIISGNLQSSSSTASWNVSTLAASLPAC